MLLGREVLATLGIPPACRSEIGGDSSQVAAAPGGYTNQPCRAKYADAAAPHRTSFDWLMEACALVGPPLAIALVADAVGTNAGANPDALQRRGRRWNHLER